jgi:hypothetical protein
MSCAGTADVKRRTVNRNTAQLRRSEDEVKLVLR